MFVIQGSSFRGGFAYVRRLSAEYPPESCAFLQIPSDGGDLEVGVGSFQAHKPRSCHAPEPFHVAEDGFDAAPCNTDFHVTGAALN